MSSSFLSIPLMKVISYVNFVSAMGPQNLRLRRRLRVPSEESEAWGI